MEKVNTLEQEPSRVTWDQLEEWARGKPQSTEAKSVAVC